MSKKSLLFKVGVLGVGVMVLGNSVFAGNFDPESIEGITDEQIEILEEARSLKEEGDKEGAKELIQTLPEEILEQLPKRGQGKGKRGGKLVSSIGEAESYEAWQAAVEEKGGDVDRVSAEEFALIQEAYELKEAGDKEGAKEILQEVWPNGRGHKFGKKMNKIGEYESYEDWQAAVEERGGDVERISADDFETIQEAQRLRESGDKEGAKELLQDVFPERDGDGKKGKSKGGKRGGRR